MNNENLHCRRTDENIFHLLTAFYIFMKGYSGGVPTPPATYTGSFSSNTVAHTIN